MKPAIEDVEGQIDKIVSGFDSLEQCLRAYFESIDMQNSVSSDDWLLTRNGYENRRQLREEYNAWKQAVDPLIEQYLPRQEHSRFTNADMILRKRVALNETEKTPSITGSNALDALYLQKSLLEAIPARIKSERLANPQQQSRELLNEELEEAERLLEERIDRAAGVLAGVALERHLIIMAESSPNDVDFNHSDNLTSLAESLRNADIIDENDKKQLVYLAGIRNKCAHADEEDPEHDEVRRLVNQADGFIERYS